MKNTIKLIIAATLVCAYQTTFAQCKMMGMNHSDAAAHNPEKHQPLINDSLTKITFKVFGNCGMCKNRIEKALKNGGVANSSWDSETKMIEVNYDASKISEDKIHHLIADAGHDTEKVKPLIRYMMSFPAVASMKGIPLLKRKNNCAK